MTVNAVIVHRIPGRTRLRVHEKRGDPDYFSRLSEQLFGIGSIQNVKANASTGSIVIEFSDTLEHLVQQLQDYIVVVENKHKSHGEQSRAVSNSFDLAPISLVSGREINLMFMIGVALAAVGVMQTAKGNILIPSISAFWYALLAFRLSR